MSEMRAAPIGHNADPVNAERLREISAEVGVRHERIVSAVRRTGEEMIGAGKLLLEAKELVKHGEFKKWIADNSRIPYRTATSWMKAASTPRVLPSSPDDLPSALRVTQEDLIEFGLGSKVQPARLTPTGAYPLRLNALS